MRSLALFHMGPLGYTVSIMLACLLSLKIVAARSDSKGIYIGTLTCTVAGGKKFEFKRTRKLSCAFDPIGDGANQGYEGTISKYGLNIGAARGKVVMVWSVFTTDTDLLPAALSGTYTGIAVGGAIDSDNGLIGGTDNQFTLLPVPTQANANVNFALAIATMELRPVPQRAAL